MGEIGKTKIIKRKHGSFIRLYVFFLWLRILILKSTNLNNNNLQNWGNEYEANSPVEYGPFGSKLSLLRKIVVNITSLLSRNRTT